MKSNSIINRQIMKSFRTNIDRTENVQRFFKDINTSKYKPLEDSDIRMLFEDREANRELIINANIRLVATIAKTYDSKDKFMDFVNEGIEGLMIAIDKYDASNPAKFSTYSAQWIMAKMSNLCKEFEMIQKTNQRLIGSKAHKFQDKFFTENMREASPEEIMDYLETQNIHIQHSSDVFTYSVKSINEDLDDDHLTTETSGEFAVRTASENDFIKKMEDEDMNEGIRLMTKILKPRELDYVIKNICYEIPYKDIAEDAGCTAERVRQIVVGALDKMKSSEVAKKYFSYFLKK